MTVRQEWQAEIERLDQGQLHIIKRLDNQDSLQRVQSAALASLVESQAEQTRMLKPISDYFAFGRVSRTIFVTLAGLAAFVAALVTTWKTFVK